MTLTSHGGALRFIRFLASGGVAAAVNIGCRWLLSLAIVYEAAVALSYLAGMATAFLLMRLFVFARSDRTALEQFSRFALVNLISFTQVWLVSVGLVRVVFPAIGFDWHDETLGHVIGVLGCVDGFNQHQPARKTDNG